MNHESQFIDLNRNEMEEINGGAIPPLAWVAIGVAAFLVISAGISVFNGYQEAKWENR